MFDIFVSVSVQIRIVFQTVLYEYGNFDAMIKMIQKHFVMLQSHNRWAVVSIECYKMYIVNHPFYPYIVDVCL